MSVDFISNMHFYRKEEKSMSTTFQQIMDDIKKSTKAVNVLDSPFNNIVIAEDIIGGLFMFLENGNIGYFAPDCLELEDMEISLSQFLYWCLHGDTDTFYKDYRWRDWQRDVSNLKNSEGVAFYPFLWAKAEDLESRHREIVPIDEIIGLEFDFLKQMYEQ